MTSFYEKEGWKGEGRVEGRESDGLWDYGLVETRFSTCTLPT